MYSLKADSLNRYQNFLKKALEQGFVYTFIFDEGLLNFESNELANADGIPLRVFPFWSNTAYPRNFIKNYQEQGLELIDLPLDGFFQLMADLTKDGHLIGAEWNQNGVGIELEADQILNDFQKLFDGDKNNP